MSNFSFDCCLQLLDDNRELFIPETQETVVAHQMFMLFATQNPPGHYGGRKVCTSFLFLFILFGGDYFLGRFESCATCLESEKKFSKTFFLSFNDHQC